MKSVNKAVKDRERLRRWLINPTSKRLRIVVQMPFQAVSGMARVYAGNGFFVERLNIRQLNGLKTEIVRRSVPPWA